MFSEEQSEPLYPVIKKGKKKLTPSQSEFNRLNKKIYIMQKNLAELPDRRNKLLAFNEEFYRPFVHEYYKHCLMHLLALDALYEKKELPEDDLMVLSEIIMNRCKDLFGDKRIWQGGMDEKALKSLFMKHEMIQTGMTEEELEREKIKGLVKAFEDQTFLKASKEMYEAKTEEEFVQATEDFLRQRKEKMEQSESDDKWDDLFKEMFTSWKNYRVERKMTQAELKRKQQEEQVNKSIRSIYMELAKNLHPDLEQDEELRVLKEERMKQLTEAYQKKDLAALLCMQNNWTDNPVDESLADQPDQLLKGYNKVLKAQLKKLEDEMDMAVYSIPDLSNELCEILRVSVNEMDTHLESFKEKVETSFAIFKKGCKSELGKRGLKRIIKECRKEKSVANIFEELFSDRKSF